MELGVIPFTVFDFETTGLYPYAGDRICEIGAIRFGGGSKTRKFHTLVDPERPVSAGAFSVNGITDSMLKGAPRIEEALPSFMDFIKDSVLVAYNAGFDLGFLESALGPDSKDLEKYLVVDALGLARRLFPGAGRFSLTSVSGHLGISVRGEHRAMADATMAFKVFRKELSVLRSSGVKSVEEIAYKRAAGRQPFRRSDVAKIRLIEEAIRKQEKLNIVYRSVWTDAVTERTVAPTALRHGYDRSYLVAFCHTAGADRNFRIDGIIGIGKAPEAK